jgi:hypothetical protein
MKSIASLLTTILTVAALFALTGWQVTSETASTRLLGRLGAALVEIDRWLPAHQEDIQLLARDRTDGAVLIRDLPIQVTLPAVVVVDADEAELRTMITEEMGRQLYEDGNSAFRDNEGDEASLAINEPVRWTVTLLGSGMHGFWLAAMVLTLLLALAAAASVMTTGEMPMNSIAIGAVIGIIACFGFWVLMQFADGFASSPADREIILILEDGAKLGMRSCGGVAIPAAVLALLMSFAQSRGSGAHYNNTIPPTPDTNWS